MGRAYKYINEKDGTILEGILIGNKVMIDGKVYNEYEMIKDNARYIRVGWVRYIREDFIK